MNTRQQLDIFAYFLEENAFNLVELLVALLNIDTMSEGPLRRLRAQLCHPRSLNRLVAALLNNPESSVTTRQIAQNITSHQLVHEMAGAISKSSGNHYNASHMTADKILEFSREKIAIELEGKCPCLWRLIRILLNTSAARSAVNYLELREDYLTNIVLESDSTSPRGLDSELNEIGGTYNVLEPVMAHDLGIGSGRRDSGEKAQQRQASLTTVVSR